jgi:hypothetical protein
MELTERERGVLLASIKMMVDLIRQNRKGVELLPEYYALEAKFKVG